MYRELTPMEYDYLAMILEDHIKENTDYKELPSNTKETDHEK